MNSKQMVVFTTSLNVLNSLMEVIASYDSVPSPINIISYNKYRRAAKKIDAEVDSLKARAVLRQVLAEWDQKMQEAVGASTKVHHEWAAETWVNMGGTDDSITRVPSGAALSYIDTVLEGPADQEEDMRPGTKLAIRTSFKENLVKHSYITKAHWNALTSQFATIEDFFTFLEEEGQASVEALDGSAARAERLAKIQNMGKFSSRRTFDVLVGIAAEESEDTVIRVAAAVEMGQLDHAQCPNHVKGQLVTLITLGTYDQESKKFFPVKNRFVREAICLVLGEMAHKDAVAGLRKVWAKDVITDVRLAAEQALKRIRKIHNLPGPSDEGRVDPVELLDEFRAEAHKIAAELGAM